MAKTSKTSANEILVGSSKIEPTIDLNDYNHTLSSALNFYNIHFSDRDYKSNALEYASTLGIKISGNAPEYVFRGVGAVARLIMRNCTLRFDDVQRCIEKLNKIKNDYEKSKSEPIISNVVPIKQLDLHVIDFLNQIDDELIDTILAGTKVTADSYITQYASKEYNKSQSKEVIQFINSKIKYYTDTYKAIKDGCEQTKEAFDAIPSTRINNVSKQLQMLLNGINNVLVKDKVIKIKAKKEITPLLQVKDVPYLKEYESIKGIHPKDCINQSEIWIYDAEARDVIVLRSIKDTKFIAKGMTFINVDVDRSSRKKLRKTEDLYLFINSLETINKKYMLNTLESIKTKEQSVSGRMSDTKIIIQIFK